MKTKLLFALSFGLLAATGCGNFRDRAVLSNGPWVVEWFKQDGQVKTLRFEMVFSANNDSVNIFTGDKVHKGTYELHGEKERKEIDIKPDGSNLEDPPMYGIYSLDADGKGLVLCLSTTKRPKRFEAKAGTDWMLIKLRRD